MDEKKNRDGENGNNMKLKLKKDIYGRNKRWKREEWNINKHNKVRLAERKLPTKL